MLKEIDLPGKKDSLALSIYFTHTNPFIKDSESESSQSSLPLSDSNDSDAFNFEKNNYCIGGPESESNFLPFFNQIPEDFNSDNLLMSLSSKKSIKPFNFAVPPTNIIEFANFFLKSFEDSNFGKIEPPIQLNVFISIVG